MKKILLGMAGLLLAAALYLTVRQAWAAAQAERLWQSAWVEALPDTGSTSRLEILPIYEEAGDESRYQIGHGLAYLIRTDSAAILVDVGNNPAGTEISPLAANMEALGVSWEQIDAVFFSHFHPDHVGGPEAWKAGAASLGRQPVDFRDRPVYAPASFEFPGAVPTLLADPSVLGPGVASTGAIAYGETYPISLYAAMGTEQALAVNVTGQGIVLIMGCGHPTVERIAARAEALFEQPVVGIVGGFHYEGQRAEEIQTHIASLQARDLRLVAPSPHDSSPDALHAFQAAFPEAYREVRVGAPILFPE